MDKELMDCLLSDDEIAERAIVCWADLLDHEKVSFVLVAKAQLEKCQAYIDSQVQAERNIIADTLEGVAKTGDITPDNARRYVEYLREEVNK